MTKLLLFLLGLLAPVPLSAAPQEADRKASPFDGLRWAEDRPEVLLGTTWYRPLSIDGVPVLDLLEFCEERWPGKARKRFAEDLVEAMALLGTEVGDEVDLVLESLPDGTRTTLEGVELSEAKRRAIRDAAARSRPVRREPPASLPRAGALEDLAAFAGGLEDQFAYLRWKGVDLRAGLDEIEAALGPQDPVPRAKLAEALDVLLKRFGDGHARVSGAAPRASSWPPVLLVEAGGGVVALKADRTGFLDRDRPFVVTLDGRPLAAWLDDLRPWITDGSPQLVRRRALRDLRELAAWRERLGLSPSPSATYGLAAKPGAKKAKETVVGLGRRRPIYGAWPAARTRELDGGSGYLRLPQMDDSVPDLRRAMAEFRDTRGLVVDVRGNGGGSRELLLALAGYLVGPDEPPRVGNLAVYRTSPRFDADHLVARFMYRADDPHWSEAQRAAIEATRANFEPEWDPGAGFSDWHYLVLDRTGHADEYFYDRPVVILSDADCFSATDIFLGALHGHPRVTLMGAASGGGSARTQRFRLPNSGLEVNCASMASFRPDGRLYDGRGIEVDVEVEPRAEDFLLGGPDHVLDRALRHLRAAVR